VADEGRLEGGLALELGGEGGERAAEARRLALSQETVLHPGTGAVEGADRRRAEQGEVEAVKVAARLDELERGLLAEGGIGAREGQGARLGPLDTRLGAVSMPMYGIQASLPLAPGASLVGTIGYASGNLEVGVPILGGIDIGDSNALIMDASAELRASLGRVAPLVQFGGGAIRREVSVAGISADGTDFHVSAGIGVDIPIASNVGLRLMAKDHYGKADFGGVGEFRARTRDIHALAITGGLQITF
jgi:hypothetical protein